MFTGFAVNDDELHRYCFLYFFRCVIICPVYPNLSGLHGRFLKDLIIYCIRSMPNLKIANYTAKIVDHVLDVETSVSSLKNNELTLLTAKSTQATQIRYRQRNIISVLRRRGLRFFP
ncbi:MAG: DciA family protein [Candidatus Azotimanducaceae bacterium WSBS_2022_MAG_OTU7]